MHRIGPGEVSGFPFAEQRRKNAGTGGKKAGSTTGYKKTMPAQRQASFDKH